MQTCEKSKKKTVKKNSENSEQLNNWWRKCEKHAKNLKKV